MHEIIYYRNDLKHYARKLRNNMTRAEKILWHRIRRKAILGLQFCRQKPIGPYILDFYCKNPKIAIELDGPIHEKLDAIKYDEDKDFYLKSVGIKVLRFKNADIYKNVEEVIQKISSIILPL